MTIGMKRQVSITAHTDDHKQLSLVLLKQSTHLLYSSHASSGLICGHSVRPYLVCSSLQFLSIITFVKAWSFATMSSELDSEAVAFVPPSFTSNPTASNFIPATTRNRRMAYSRSKLGSKAPYFILPGPSLFLHPLYSPYQICRYKVTNFAVKDAHQNATLSLGDMLLFSAHDRVGWFDSKTEKTQKTEKTEKMEK
jgi:hypothetical protein